MTRLVVGLFIGLFLGSIGYILYSFQSEPSSQDDSSVGIPDAVVALGIAQAHHSVELDQRKAERIIRKLPYNVRAVDMYYGATPSNPQILMVEYVGEAGDIVLAGYDGYYADNLTLSTLRVEGVLSDSSLVVGTKPESRIEAEEVKASLKNAYLENRKRHYIKYYARKLTFFEQLAIELKSLFDEEAVIRDLLNSEGLRLDASGAF